MNLLQGDCLEVLKTLPEGSVDSCVTDPPYHLVSIVKRFAKSPARNEATVGKAAFGRHAKGFMGKSWDGGDIAFRPELWAEVLRVLKPGGHVLAFGGTRTYHRMACAIEDAGFEIRDQIGWAYGSGFPKSHDVSKAIDRAAGAEREKIRVPADEVRNPKATGAGRDGMDGATRPWIEEALARGYHEKDGDEPITDSARQWEGWGTALKPAWEPIVLARKPLIGTVAANVQQHGTGALNIDGCRVEGEKPLRENTNGKEEMFGMGSRLAVGTSDAGRWPANVIHDGSEEVVAAFPQAIGQIADASSNSRKSAARFFYCAKASKSDRGENTHPTVKPTALMQYLCRLVTPPGGTVLDPFMGSGSTGKAALREGFRFIGIEREAEYFEIAQRRIYAEVFADE